MHYICNILFVARAIEIILHYGIALLKKITHQLFDWILKGIVLLLLKEITNIYGYEFHCPL